MNIRTLLLLVLVILVFGVSSLVGVYTDMLWFSELGYGSVFWTMLGARLALFGLAAATVGAILFVGVRLVTSQMKKPPKTRLIALIAVVSAVVAGAVASNSWDTLLRYLNPTVFGVADPVFAADVGFYFFELPFYTFIWSMLFAAVLLSAIVAGAFHLLAIMRIQEAIHVSLEEGSGAAAGRYKRSKAVGTGLHTFLPLVGFISILLGVGLLLARYSVLYSGLGVVHGAGWTELNVVLPFISILAALVFVAAALSFVGGHIRKPRLPLLGMVALGAIAIIGSIAIFAAQAYVVAPDELNREHPYLERNIEFTRQAYGLNRIQEFPFPVGTALTLEDIQANAATMQNVRLWDWKPLLTTYKQVQLIRTYYDFADADVDRYTLNGEYRQVIVSTREVNPDLLPERTWVNEHLVFTHGYGITMTPVREVSTEGLPLLYIKDIPPQSTLFNITRPEIYFGELGADYVIVKSQTEELDYPLGEKNVYTTYDGRAGISLGSPLVQFAMAIRFGSPEILVSGSITPESRILINRNIRGRVRTLAPFLAFDSDPYIVVDDGRLYWMIDAYTIGNSYPYSERRQGINYIRNPVKVVIDAYDGTTSFYVIETEPLISTYMKIFPELFKPVEVMPAGLRAHIRYPLDLFTIQSDVFSTYHMKDARVFYNKEDIWEFPMELFGRDRIIVEPYYLVMQLPGEAREEYILFETFTPRAKNNIISWLAGRSDPPNYGELILYRFPKEKLIFGPMQLEARVDQDAEIAQQLALWSQAGTRVIRGHVIIIPIDGSLLYIEPIYLRATEEAIPELRRVVVMFGDRLTMQPTFDAALAVLFGKASPDSVPAITEGTVKELAAAALAHYNAAQAALKEGDWTTYGQELAALQQVLEELASI